MSAHTDEISYTQKQKYNGQKSTDRRFVAAFVFFCSPEACYSDKFHSRPAPMVYDDTFYIYTGHDEDGEHNEFVMNEWRVYSSKDMVNWTDHGSPMSLDTFKWAEWGAWASQCVERDGNSSGMSAV